MKVLKFATGQDVPKGAKYLCTIKNGAMHERGKNYSYVWHYFLVEEDLKSLKENLTDPNNKKGCGKYLGCVLRGNGTSISSYCGKEGLCSECKK